MKIIDTRLRPPYKSIKDQAFFDPAHCEPFAATYNMTMAPSAKEKSMDLLIQEMNKAGVVKGLTPFHNRGSGMKNADFSDLNKEYPGKFVGFVYINPQAGVEKAFKDIDENILKGDFTGVNFEPGLDSVPWKVDNDFFFPIYEKCEAENIPVYMTWGGLLTEPWVYDPNAINNVAKNFPKMKMMLSHAGFPRNGETCVVAMNHPNVYLNVDLYVINCFGAQDFITAANYRLKNQICFGSAYPYADINKMVDYYLQAGFREEVIENVMYKNAASFLGE